MSLSIVTTVTVSAPVGRNRWRAIRREPATLSNITPQMWELSAEDLGCEPGTVYKVAVLDAEDNELRACLIEAR